jgi:glycosyltransferase involved in cell wall biosynthesis
MRSTGKVSVIIPTHGDRDLTNVLNSLYNSTYQDLDIVVVDEGKERSAQRNIGIYRSRGNYLLFLDSDTLVHPRLIEDCMVGMKFCKSIYLPEEIITKGYFGRLRNWERQFYTGTLVDVVRFIKKDCCPYFDEDLHGPEDSDWDRKVKGLRMISNFPLYHFDNIGFIEYCKKKIYYTKSMGYYKQKNPDDKILTFRYRCWTVFTQEGKWKMLLRKPHYTLALIGLLLVRGLIYKCTRKKHLSLPRSTPLI